MTEEALVQLMIVLCMNFNKEERFLCYEKIWNCAIIKDGKILDQNSILKNCTKKLHQENNE